MHRDVEARGWSDGSVFAFHHKATGFTFGDVLELSAGHLEADPDIIPPGSLDDSSRAIVCKSMDHLGAEGEIGQEETVDEGAVDEDLYLNIDDGVSEASEEEDHTYE